MSDEVIVCVIILGLSLLLVIVQLVFFLITKCNKDDL